MPADKGVRLDDRQRIANFREQPIETNEYHSVDGAEGEFLWSGSPQNVDLLPQLPNLCLKHYPRPDQIDNHPTNEPAKIPHCARSSSDSRSTAKQDRFATGTGTTLIAAERTGRRGHGIELDPYYCDTIVRRFEDVHDLKAIHVETRLEFDKL